jgi:hypothetical protein
MRIPVPWQGVPPTSFREKKVNGFTARSSQADKCLLSVVRICMALHHDEYYIGAMTEAVRQALVMKLQHRKGPIVQMGFGMHAALRQPAEN